MPRSRGRRRSSRNQIYDERCIQSFRMEPYTKSQNPAMKLHPKLDRNLQVVVSKLASSLQDLGQNYLAQVSDVNQHLPNSSLRLLTISLRILRFRCDIAKDSQVSDGNFRQSIRTIQTTRLWIHFVLIWPIVLFR